MSVVGDICLFCVGPGYDGLLEGVLFRSDVCADYDGVNVFHLCLNFGVVYGVLLLQVIIIVVSSNSFVHSSTHCFPTSLNVKRSEVIQRTGMCKLGAL